MQGNSEQVRNLCLYLLLHLFQTTSQTLEKYYQYRKIKIKMVFICALTGPLLFDGGGGGGGGGGTSIR